MHNKEVDFQIPSCAGLNSVPPEFMSTSNLRKLHYLETEYLQM